MTKTQPFLHLVDSMGGDLAVVNSARVSYGKSSSELTEKDEKLIKDLLVNHHGTPFEQATFTFYVRCPIFVAREWMRHRIGSFNEVSGRYKKLDADFYMPKRFRIPNPDAEQLQYKYLDADDELNEKATTVLRELYEHMEWAYNVLLEEGIAKEHSRLALGVSVYTEFRWTVNARSLMNFIALRNHPTAMQEIRSYALIIEHMFKDAMPATYAAFIAANRVAP